MSTNIEKPIYTLSASLLNKLKWYKAQKTKEKKLEAIEQLKQSLRKEFVTNEYIEAGNRFEEEVFDNKHPELYVDLNGDKQKWFNKYIDWNEHITLKLVGKFDVVNDTEIFDIKRTQNYYAQKYGDDYTIQHDLYLYMNPSAERFWYSIGYGPEVDPEGKPLKLGYTKLMVERKPNLEKYIMDYIAEFLEFLYKEELIELYFENFRVYK